MKILQSVLIPCTILFFLAGCTAESKKDDRPNVLLLLADDMGYGELGSYGQEVILTPYLDQLAKDGMRFSNFYTGTSVCSPSRAVLMTGMHTGHVSIRGNKGKYEDKWDRVALRKSEQTMGEMMKQAGYQTAFVGKWHLGVPEDMSTWAMGRGFDYAIQEQWGVSDKGEVFDERMHWIDNRMDSSFYDFENYECLDEFRTNFALRYLEEKAANKPFFLLMSYRIPHAHEFHIRHNDMYSGNGWPEIERTHAARITMLDRQINRLLSALKERGELDNTLVIFTSDNGPHNANKHDRHFFNSAGGLKGYKRDLYEGGIRVPMIASWKGKIKPASQTDQPAVFYDIMPTLAEVAGVDAPAQTDGISILPTLLGKSQPQHGHLYWEIQDGASQKGFKQAAKKGKWKAVRYGASYKTELYDLSTDPFEAQDLSSSHPELVQEFNQILQNESKKIEHYPFSGGIFRTTESN
ncbi:MAG: sulfatase-like hydrolase/transferase [Cyclobacteriaceae bacterium]